MVSFSHEFLVDLFRNRGELAPALLEVCAQIVFPHNRVEERSIDLSQVTSTEYRADAVVVLNDGEGKPAAAIVVEVQLRADEAKEYAWPVYVTALRARLRCPVVLLVVAPDPGTARWARTPLALGHPRFCLEPVVIELDDVPRVTDPADAQRLPELAVLSALAHPELTVVTAARAAIACLPADQIRLYWDVITAALPPSLRELLESHMQGYVYQSEFARKYYAEGQEVGLRRAAHKLLQEKLPTFTAEDQATLEALHDQDALLELVGSLGGATNADQARAALAAVRARG